MMIKIVWRENRKLLTGVMLTYAVLVVLAVAFIRPSLPFVLGLTFGTAVALLNFFEMALTFYRAVNMPSHKAQQFAVIKYLMRYAVTGAVLLVSVLSPKINPFGTAVGLLIIKGVLYGTQLNKNNKKAHQEFTRKEE